MDYDEVASYYGNASKVAEALHISRQAVSKWRHKGIPLEQQFRIQLKTKGKLKASMSELERKWRRAA